MIITRRISGSQLSRFGEFIEERFGLHFPEKRWRDLERYTLSLADDFGFPDGESCVRWIVTAQLSSSELDTIARRLTIGETYFYRERKSFDALQADILPSIISSRRGKEQRLRIWSAGCATGEEAYSIAILLHRMIPDLPKWNITILATDINSLFIRKASAAEYGEWSFRGVPHWLKEKYFSAKGKGRYMLSDTIRKMVVFARLNLAEDPYPSLLNNTNAMDLIFCRNVLMYFSPDRIRKTVSGFRHSLLDGGWLVVSPCEVSHALFPGFKTANFNGAVFYWKERRAQSVGTRYYEKAGGNGTAPETVGDQRIRRFKELDPLPVSTDAAEKSRPTPYRRGEENRGETGAITATAAQAPLSAGSPVNGPSADGDGSNASLLEKAESFYRRGEYGGAAAILVELFAKCPRGPASPADGEAAVLLARALANQGKFAAALEWLEKAVALDRLNPGPYYLKATIFQEQGFDDAAAVSLKKAIYVDHGFVLAHFALAGLNLRRGKREEAAKCLENAASLLRGYGDDDLLPGGDGLSARRLAEIIAETREGVLEN